MSDAGTARGRNAWMPNRMFDPVSNPFAIQNLLEREQQTFVGAPDERDAAAFGPDPFGSGRMVRAFEVDHTLHGGNEDFNADQAIKGGFAATPGQSQPRFHADPQAGHDRAPVPPPAAAVPPARAARPAPAAPAAAPEQAAAPAATPAAERPAAPAAPVGPDRATIDKMIEEARAEAYARGLKEGMQQGEELGRQQGLQQGRDEERPRAHREGYDEGFAAGLAQAQAEQQGAAQLLQQQQSSQLQAVIDGLRELMYDPDELFEPMKKLAVHLAEQLVRSELSQSPQAISRLVDNALHELNASGDKPVLVHLHPDDLELYRPTVAQFADSLHLRPDATLERGSVRASLDGSVVEDLIVRRVEGLKKSLAQPPAPGWRSGAGRLAARAPQDPPLEDVTPVEPAVPDIEATPAEGHA